MAQPARQRRLARKPPEPEVGSPERWFTDESIAAWTAEPRTTRGGQPWYSPLAILTALTLRAVFRLALRQTEGLIGSIMGLLGLDLPVADHTTLSRRAATVRSTSAILPVHAAASSELRRAGEAGREPRRFWPGRRSEPA